jgi:hypothetical protein
VASYEPLNGTVSSVFYRERSFAGTLVLGCVFLLVDHWIFCMWVNSLCVPVHFKEWISRILELWGMTHIVYK